MGGGTAQEHFDRLQRPVVSGGAGEEVARALRRVPALEGAPIRLRLRGGLRVARGSIVMARKGGTEVHAASFPRRRLMVLEAELRRDRRDFARILIHELMHFVWVRLGNPTRREWERLLAAERSRRELGWSAELRRGALTPADSARRTRRWREYVCESFCDTGAWLWCGARKHPEFTLPARERRRRAAWFAELVEARRGRLPV